LTAYLSMSSGRLLQVPAKTAHSNGIRFSISVLSPDTARILPTIYQDRNGVSLYDAQYDKGTKIPIPGNVVDEVVAALLHFKTTCGDFGVRDDRIRVVATEATRNAINSEAFLARIEKDIGWKPELLPKEEEGRLGAVGVASSVSDLEGLVLDMGGGSFQMTWVDKKNDGQISMGSSGSISLPYGAAALKARMDAFHTEGKGNSMNEELAPALRKGLDDLQIPPKKAYNLYLSGGGFRGWGHILIATSSIQPYPIPIVNGFHVPGSEFLPSQDQLPNPAAMHRISSRRATQVPAVQTLIRALVQALHPASISSVTFCQGGVREGLLYSTLPSEIRSQHPLTAATRPYAPASASELLNLLRSAIPKSDILTPALLTSTINLLNTHASNPKDIRSSAALHCTTTGLLSSTHGLLHSDRALLALILCERWSGDIAPIDETFFANLQTLCGPERSWWAKYAGRVAAGLANMYPAGVVRDGGVGLSASVGEGVMSLEVEVLREEMLAVAERWAEEVRKLGKKKNWVGGKEGWGMGVEVMVVRQNGR